MKRKITTIILVAFTLGILFYYNNNDMVTLQVQALKKEHWTSFENHLVNENQEKITQVYSVDSRGQMLMVPLLDYFELLKATEGLTRDVEMKSFADYNRKTYKGYDLISYKHLSHGFMPKEAAISLGDESMNIKLSALAYGTFEGGVTLPEKLLDHLKYDVKAKINIKVSYHEAFDPTDSTFVFKALLDTTVVLNQDVLMALVPSFKKDVVGFIEIRD